MRQETRFEFRKQAFEPAPFLGCMLPEHTCRVGSVCEQRRKGMMTTYFFICGLETPPRGRSAWTAH